MGNQNHRNNGTIDGGEKTNHEEQGSGAQAKGLILDEAEKDPTKPDPTKSAQLGLNQANPVNNTPAQEKPARTAIALQKRSGTSTRPAAVGDSLDCYCPGLWDGPMPCVVVGRQSGANSEFGQQVDVNVFVNAVTYPNAAEEFDTSADGNTIACVPVFDMNTRRDEADPTQHPELGAVWCCWRA